MNLTEDDKRKFIEYLNIVAKYAKFEFNTDQILQYHKLLSHMQQKLLPKIEANILEIKKIVEPKTEG